MDHLYQRPTLQYCEYENICWSEIVSPETSKHCIYFIDNIEIWCLPGDYATASSWYMVQQFTIQRCMIHAYFIIYFLCMPKQNDGGIHLTLHWKVKRFYWIIQIGLDSLPLKPWSHKIKYGLFLLMGYSRKKPKTESRNMEFPGVSKK